MAAELDEGDEQSGIGLVGQQCEHLEKHRLQLGFALQKHGEERSAGVEALLRPERAALRDLLRGHGVRELQSLQRHGDGEEQLLGGEDLRGGSGLRHEPRQVRSGDEEQPGHRRTGRREEKRRHEAREVLRQRRGRAARW